MTKCNVCFEENPGEGNYCQKCGNLLANTPTTKANIPEPIVNFQPEKGKKSGKTSVILAIISTTAVLFVALGGIIPDQYGVTLADRKSGLLILPGLLYVFSSFFGIIFSIISLSRRKNKKNGAVFGLVMNSLVFCVPIFGILVGIIVSAGNTSSIKGTVTVNGYAYPQTSMMLFNGPTGEIVNSKTDEYGFYAFNNLSEGAYGIATSFYINSNYSCSINDENFKESSYFDNSLGLNSISMGSVYEIPLKAKETKEINLEIICKK